MYKPNGEERMTQTEERQRREIIAEHRLERIKAASSVAEVLGTPIYASLVRSSISREETVGSSFENLR
jgi:hypothetical protein